MSSEARRGAVATEKAVNLFLSVVEDAGATPLSVLAQRSGIPQSTAQRMAAVFLHAGLLSRVGRGRYAAGMRLVSLAPAADFHSVLVRASRGPLSRLARDLRATVHLGVLEGDMVTYLVKEHGGGANVLTSESIQLEAYCSGVGKVLLAHLDEEAREEYLESAPFVALTARTITNPDALRRELQRVKVHNSAYDDAELQDDLYCVAVPVHDAAGAVVAAISASKPNFNWRASQHLEAMNACAHSIASRLGAA